MKPISCNQEMGDTGRLLCPGAPQGPTQYQVCDCVSNIRKGQLRPLCLSVSWHVYP